MYGYDGPPEFPERLKGVVRIAAGAGGQAMPGEKEDPPLAEGGLLPVSANSLVVVHAADEVECRGFGAGPPQENPGGRSS